MKMPRFYSSIKYLSMSVFTLIFLSGCTWLAQWPPVEQGQVFQPQPETTAPAGVVVQTAEGTWLQAPAEPTAIPVQTDADRARELASAKAQRDQALARLSQLETQVAQLQTNVGTIVPAMNQMAQTQSQIQQTIQQQELSNRALMAQQQAAQLDAIAQGAQTNAQFQSNNPVQPLQPNNLQTQQVAPAHSSAPVPLANPQTRQVSAPVQSASAVTAFRLGDNPDRARLVFEGTQSMEYDLELDNGEGLMVITLSNMDWAAVRERALSQTSLVKSYTSVANDNGGTSVILQLKRPARVEWVQRFEPVAGKPHRLIVDLDAL